MCFPEFKISAHQLAIEMGRYKIREPGGLMVEHRTPIHVISPFFGGISLFLSKSPYLEFQNFPL